MYERISASDLQRACLVVVHPCRIFEAHMSLVMGTSAVPEPACVSVCISVSAHAHMEVPVCMRT